jgi:sulfite reductase beta subunit-like hemoprotein
MRKTTLGSSKTQTLNGRKGTLHINKQELANFETQVKRFKAGEWEQTEFMRFRLRQGVYGQRQPNVQMIRVKIPFGGLSSDQLRVLGKVAEKYVPLHKGHLTTRENVQFHHVPLDETPAMLDELGKVGLTTREACGNTVRNVVTHPSAGVSKEEVFDVSPYAIAYARHFLRHPITQNMPRKSKTAFSGSEKDEAMTAMHDVGFIARTKEGRKGFKMVVGGGLSTMPQMAETLTEFVPVEDYLRWAEALLRVYNQQGEERKNLMKARIKFTVKRLGIEKLREMVKEEMVKDWAKEPINLESLTAIEDESPAVEIQNDMSDPEPSKEDKAYEVWHASNVEPQAQKGFVMAYVRVERGDLFVDDWGRIADIADKFAGGRVRIDQRQNVVFRWVQEKMVYSLYKALEKANLNAPGRETIRDIVTCPGTDSCKLGITSSMGLNKALGEALDKMDMSDPHVSSLSIKASGCPNSCGQHHVANIGFHGAVMKGSGGQVPAYELFLGGNSVMSEGPVRVGQRIKARVPAKMAGQALEAILNEYKSSRLKGENFNSFTERVGTAPFEDLLAKFKAQIGPLGPDSIGIYMDWNKTTLYKLERGEGECAV